MRCGCGATFGFTEGRITSRGLICPRCQAADDLAQAHPTVAEAIRRDPADGAEALAADADAEAAVRAFVERWKGEAEAAALERLHLARKDDAALAALDAAMAPTGWSPDRPARAIALADLVRETADADLFGLLVERDAARAAETLGATAVPDDLPEAWTAALRRLAERGGAEAAASALERAGARGLPRVLALAADLARAGAGETVLRWLAKARPVGGASDGAAFAKALRDGALYGRALEALLARAEAAEAIDLLAALGETERLVERLGAAPPEAAVVAALRRAAKALPPAVVAGTLRRWGAAATDAAARKALVEAARALGGDGAAPELLDAAAEVVEAAGLWETAADLRRRAAAAAPGAERTAAIEGFRGRLVAFLGAAEADVDRTLRAALDLLLAGDAAGARRLLDPVAAEPPDARWRLTAAGRAAAYVRAAALAVELDVATSYGPALRRASDARRAGGGRTLADAGETVSDVPARARRFREALEDLLRLDLPPYWRLTLPLPPAPPSRAADREAEAARRDRLEALASPKDPTRTEAEFLRPSVRFRAAHAVSVLAAGGEEPRWGEAVPLERASAWGLLAQRSSAPLREGDDSIENRAAPKALTEAAIVRAVAFVPTAPGTYAFDRWSRFRATFADAYQVLGRDPAEIVPQAEVWAPWDPSAPAEAERSPHVPLLDPLPPAALTKDLREPTADRDSSRLDAASFARGVKV